MKKALTFVVCMLISASAYADRDGNLGFNMGYDQVTAGSGEAASLGHVGLSLRSLNHTSLEPHAEYYLGYGFSTGLRLHILWTRYFTLRLLDFGVYVPRGEGFFLRDDVQRSFDIVGGAGFSLFVWRGLEVSVGAQWMAPNPVQVLPDIARGRYTRAEEPPELSESDIVVASMRGQEAEEAIVEREKTRYTMRADFAKDVYRDVLYSPILNFSLAWYFF